MNNLIEKFLILILVFTTITFAVPLNSCAQGQVCVLGRSAPTENVAIKVLPRKPPIRKILGPGLSAVWKSFNNFRGKTKTTGTGRDKKYYEWDFTHNDIEVYDNNGKHLGSMDPSNGEMIKPPENGRRINL